LYLEIRIKMKTVFIVLVGLVMIGYACKKKTTGTTSSYTANTDCTNSSPTYNATVKVLINQSCGTSNCHNVSTKAAGIQLDTYASAKEIFTNGKALCTIYQDCTPMPKDAGKLSDATIKTLTCWVKNNCPE
jgi:hypothetical protein